MKPQQNAAMFRLAAEVIESGWCQNGFAQNADGGGACPTSPTAVSWCALGGVAVACRRLGIIMPSGDWLCDNIRLPPWFGSVSDWNDQADRTQADVVATFRAAAARLDPVPTPVPQAAPVGRPRCEPRSCRRQIDLVAQEPALCP